MAAKKDNEELEIDLLELFRVLWSKALVLILTALITGAAVFSITFFLIKPKYEATAAAANAIRKVSMYLFCLYVFV